MFKKIIVGIDGSPGGQDALALARTVAGPESRIVLVNAYPAERHASRASVVGFDELLRTDSQEMLCKLAGDADLRTVSVPDVSPARALHAAADDLAADLIVVGSCHHGSVGRALLGDVSRGTLHGASCPVAVAPKDYADKPSPFETIGVGFQSTPEAQAALDLACEMARDNNAGLRLHTEISIPAPVGIGYGGAYNWPQVETELRESAEQVLLDTAAGLDVPVTTDTSVSTHAAGLESLTEEVDVMVVGSRGWGAFRSVVLGSTGARLSHRAHCPLIVVPSPIDDEDQAERTAQAPALAVS